MNLTISLTSTPEGIVAAIAEYPTIRSVGDYPQEALEALIDAIDDYLWRRYLHSTWSDREQDLLDTWIVGEGSFFTDKDSWVNNHMRILEESFLIDERFS